MNRSILYIGALLLLGAGCGPAASTAPSPTSTGPLSPNEGAFVQPVTVDPTVCEAEPKEQESGRLTYPIADAYRNLPNLGELYTLLDCRKRDIAETRLEKQSDGSIVYTKGIRLRWEEGEPSADAKQVLQTLGFTETSPTEWQTERALNLDQLLLLRPIFLSPSKAMIHEDCVRCG